MTDVTRVSATAPESAAIDRAAALLRSGGLVAFPTETVYGLGAHALDAAAVQRLFDAKGRPSIDPLIVHVPSLDAAAPLVTGIPDVARRLAEKFWPGPLTLILPRSPVVPDAVTAGLPTVALRAPAHPVARALLDAAGVPVAAPSANLFSRPSPTTAGHVRDDLDGRIDLILDGGTTDVGVESTVLDLTTTPPVILRPGAIGVKALRRLVPDVQIHARTVADGTAAPSPGLLEKHYSPRTPMTLYEGDAAVATLVGDARLARNRGQRVGIVAADEDRRRLGEAGGVEGGPPVKIVSLGSVHELEMVAARLYAALRELDASNVDLILARAFPADEGLGVAILDRMRRAAGRRIAS